MRFRRFSTEALAFACIGLTYPHRVYVTSPWDDRHEQANFSQAHMATDPVCGMTVEHVGKPTAEHGGHTYFFCSEGCRGKFAGDPKRYLTKQGEAKPLPQGTLYTCPMHPQIVKERPGHCPICGMALEPMGIPPEITDNPELIDFTRRLKVAVPLSFALLALDMGNHVFGI